MTVTGELFIGFERVARKETFRGSDPVRGVPLEQDISIATADDIRRACQLAAQAFDTYRAMPLAARARFLERCADHLLALEEELIDSAARESGLPRGRLEGERARTVGQLRLFAEWVRRGDWLGLRIDRALPDRKPLPRSDLRLRKIPLGPVAVFGASNFPLAFSAAGGDVAAALAAGCPVIVKAHPSHPGTSELAAGAISKAASELGLPNGTYSHLSGPSHDLGIALTCDVAVKAVAFTGSRRGGLALMAAAASRQEPIPVYAEMSSINPVILLPGALQKRADAIAAGFVGSLTLGAGQFCTNPGLVLAVEDEGLGHFIAAVRDGIDHSRPAIMLSADISAAYHQGIGRLQAHTGVVLLALGKPGALHEAHAAFYSVSAPQFLDNPALSDEVFGPSSLLVRCRNHTELLEVAGALQGQLTATLQLETSDYPAAATIIPMLEKRVGRILVNGWPTGVEVCHAMVHGGPYPSTSDPRTTSVGTLAIERFLRPVCYQDVPDALLPAELRRPSAHPYRTLVDGADQEPA